MPISAAGFLAGCSNSSKSPDLSQSLRSALDQAGLKKVSVSQDRDKGVVTLGGRVALDSEKAQAESIASSVADGQVVSDQIAVLPAGAKLALLAGMRPGEIFGLKWARMEADYADIRQRVYRGDVDSPKSVRSVRFAALSDGLLASIDDWRAVALDTSVDAWVFPSEKLTTPLAKDNCWRRSFLPKLTLVGLAWADFQVMRRTHSSLLKELDVDPHVRAEQMGHTLDVNENVYTITSLKRRKEAVNALERAIGA